MSGTEIEVLTLPSGDLAQPGRNGGLLRLGGGSPPNEIRNVLREARRENFASLRTLVAIRDDTELDAEKRIKAAVAIMQLSGVTREKPRSTKRATISVVRASPAEQVAKVHDAIARHSSGTDDQPTTTP